MGAFSIRLNNVRRLKTFPNKALDVSDGLLQMLLGRYVVILFPFPPSPYFRSMDRFKVEDT